MGKAGAVAVAAPQAGAAPRSEGETVTSFFLSKINELELLIKDKSHNLRRLEAQRNELNTQGELEEERVFSGIAVAVSAVASLSRAKQKNSTPPFFSPLS